MMKLPVIFFWLIISSFTGNAQWEYKGLGGIITNQLTIYQDSIYASTDNGIYVKYLSGTDTMWTLRGAQGKNVINTLFTKGDHCISIMEVRPHYSQIYFSGDRGSSLTLLHPDTSQFFIYNYGSHMSKSPLSGDTLYFLHHQVKTFDEGQTWSPLNYIPQKDKFIYAAPDNPAEVYAGGENYFFAANSMVSSDAGRTWQDMNNASFFAGDNAIHGMCISGNDLYAVGEGVVAHRNRNGGSWNQLLNTFSSAEWGLYYLGLDISPVNDSFIYVSGFNNNHSKIRLLLSPNKGMDWDTLSFVPGITNAAYGIYDLKVHHKNGKDIVWLGGTGIYSYTNDVAPNPPLSIHSAYMKPLEVILYPNPSFDELNLYTSGAGEGEVYISSLSGTILYKDVFKKGEKTINLSFLSTGVYICKIVMKDGKQTTVKKLVKR